MKNLLLKKQCRNCIHYEGNDTKYIYCKYGGSKSTVLINTSNICAAQEIKNWRINFIKRFFANYCWLCFKKYDHNYSICLRCNSQMRMFQLKWYYQILNHEKANNRQRHNNH